MKTILFATELCDIENPLQKQVWIVRGRRNGKVVTLRRTGDLEADATKELLEEHGFEVEIVAETNLAFLMSELRKKS